MIFSFGFGLSPHLKLTLNSGDQKLIRLSLIVYIFHYFLSVLTFDISQ